MHGEKTGIRRAERDGGGDGSLTSSTASSYLCTMVGTWPSQEVTSRSSTHAIVSGASVAVGCTQCATTKSTSPLLCVTGKVAASTSRSSGKRPAPSSVSK